VQEQAAFVAWLDESPSHNEAYQEAIRQPTASEQAAAAAMRAQRLARRRRLQQIAVAASVALVAVAGAGVYVLDDEYRTAVGQKRTVTLRDGSIVELAGATRLREDFNQQERRVELLEGEALFQVEHNPLRPFKVDAGLQIVQATGTAFDVSRVDMRVEVQVTDGSVAVTTKGMNADTGPAVVRLVKGEAVAFQGAVTTGGVRKIPVEKMGTWRQGKLTFESAPLSRVLDAMSRQYGGRFIVDDPNVANKPISISFKTDAAKKDVIQAVARQMSLEPVEQPDKTIRFMPGSARTN
jgi:transmembrane sensor